MVNLIDIEQTVSKLKQLGVPVRLKGNDADRRRVLDVICRREHLAPVFIGDFD